MKFANVSREQKEAKPGLKGKCPNCEGDMIAMCGPNKVHHWAHHRVRNCDPWWENETEWHRTWKSHFPKEQQEVIQYSESGEKHIADVKNEQGYVIEFQHSPIKSEEKQARENFYKKMIWVVDGTRRTTDRRKFLDSIAYQSRIGGREDLLESPGDYRCPLIRDWGKRTVPVFFDFNEDSLWALLPIRENGKQYVFRTYRTSLLQSLNPTSDTNHSFDRLLSIYIQPIFALEWRLQVENEKRARNPLLF